MRVHLRTGPTHRLLQCSITSESMEKRLWSEYEELKSELSSDKSWKTYRGQLKNDHTFYSFFESGLKYESDKHALHDLSRMIQSPDAVRDARRKPIRNVQLSQKRKIITITVSSQNLRTLDAFVFDDGVKKFIFAPFSMNPGWAFFRSEVSVVGLEGST